MADGSEDDVGGIAELAGVATTRPRLPGSLWE